MSPLATFASVSPNSPEQAMVGFEAAQNCYPSPVISNDEGTARIPYVPTARDRLDPCTDANGRQTTGLTYEGELNKVRKTACVLLFAWTNRVS